MCNIVKANKELDREVTLDDIKCIAKNLQNIGAGIILLTGGEPFIRKDLPDIIRILKEYGLSVRYQTSGLKTTPEQLKACVKAGGFDINVSLDTLDPKKQNEIDSVPQSWERSIQTIANISQIFPSRPNICGIGSVISKRNYKEIEDIVRFAHRIGWYSSLVPIHTIDELYDYHFRSRDRSFAFSEENYDEVDKIINLLISMKKEGYTLFDSTPYLESCKAFIRTGRPTWRNKKTGICDSPNLYFIIRPNGDFGICCDHNFPEKVSVIDKKFPEIYFSEFFRRKVKEITSKCPGCQYGSYPEVTLAVRNRSAFRERMIDILHPQSAQKKPYSYEQLLSIIDEIRCSKKNK